MQDVILVIGIDKYQPGILTAGELHLSTSVSGASALSERLVQLNPPSKPITLLQAAATKENVLEELNNLASKELNSLIFYFSGHARPEGLVMNAVDVKQTETLINSKELGDALSGTGAREHVVILDCCASGTVGRGVFEILGENALVIASTTGDQSAWQNDKMEQSYFCDAVLEALSQHSTPLTKANWLQAGTTIRALVSERVYLEANGREQVPTTFGQFGENDVPSHNSAHPSVIQIVKKRIRSIAATAAIFVIAAGLFSTFFFYRIGTDANQRVVILYGPKGLAFISDLFMGTRARTPFVLSNFNNNSRQLLIEQSLGGVWGNRDQNGNQQWWGTLADQLRENGQTSFAYDTYVGNLSGFNDDQNLNNRLVPSFIFHFALQNGMTEQDVEARFGLSPQSYWEQLEPELKRRSRLSRKTCGDEANHPPNINIIELPTMAARRASFLFETALRTDIITDEHIFDSLFAAQDFATVNYGFMESSPIAGGAIPYEYGLGFFNLPIALAYRSQVSGKALSYETIDETLSALGRNSEACALTANILKAAMGLGDDNDLEASFWASYEKVKADQIRRHELTGHLDPLEDVDEIFEIEEREGLFFDAYGNFDPIFGIAFLIRHQRINHLPDHIDAWDQMIESARANLDAENSEYILDFDDDNRLKTLTYEGRLPPFVLEAILDEAQWVFRRFADLDTEIYETDLYDLQRADLGSWAQWMSMAAPQSPYFDQASRDAFILQLEIVERLKNRVRDLGQTGFATDFTNFSEYLLDHFWSFVSLNADIPGHVSSRLRNWSQTELMQTYRPSNGMLPPIFRTVPTGSRLLAFARYAMRHSLDERELELLISATSDYYQGRLQRPINSQIGTADSRLISDIESQSGIIGVAIANQLWAEVDPSGLAQALVTALERPKDDIYEDQILTSAWNFWLQLFPTDERLQVATDLFNYWAGADDTYVKFQTGIALATLYISMGADYGPERAVVRAAVSR